MDINPYKFLQAPPEIDDAFRRHRAALMTVCTPVLLMWLYDLKPHEMPIMSLVVAKTNVLAFWKIMLTLIGWSFFVLSLDLGFIFMKPIANIASYGSQ